MDTATTSSASLVLAAASFAETDGTLVSLEGRAQRHYPVFLPPQERHPAWVWLLACMKELEHAAVSTLHHFDDVTRACAADVPALAGITAAADKVDLVKAELEKLIAPTLAEAGCVQYDLHQDNENPTQFLFYENWESRALWQAHMGNQHLKDFLSATEGAVAELTINEMTHIT